VETIARSADREIGKARAEFLVYDRDVELSSPAADPDLMASLAAWTRDEGGRAVPPEQVQTLLAELAAKDPDYEVRETRWKIAGTQGDAWVMLLVMTACLTGEWYLRKRWGLV
jgi:hypothetical protein